MIDKKALQKERLQKRNTDIRNYQKNTKNISKKR